MRTSPQLIADRADELAFQRLAFLQGRLPLGQGLFKFPPGRDIRKGHQGRTIGQGAGLPGGDPAIGRAPLALDRHAAFRIGVGDPRLQPQPQGGVGQGDLAQFGYGVEVARRFQPFGRHGPEGLERLIVQAQAAVRPEHGHSVIQLVQRRGLDLQLGIEAAAQGQLTGNVGEDQQDSAQRVRLSHDPEGPSVRQGPAVVRGRFGRAVKLQLPGLPSGVVDDLGQHAALAQPVKEFAVRRPFVQPGGVEGEQGLEGGVVKGELP